MGSYLLLTGNRNNGARPKLWDQTFADDVFFRCSKQMKGQRTGCKNMG